MKKISTILLALIGLQTSLNAEIIYFEKLVQREESQVLTYNEYSEQRGTLEADFDRKKILLGTIRLEEGEELRIRNRKWTKASCCSDETDGLIILGGGNSTGIFFIEINFDKFTQNESIETGYNSGDRSWWESRKGQGLKYDGSLWPVEGPATIKIHIRPAWYLPRTNANNTTSQLYKTLIP